MIGLVPNASLKSFYLESSVSELLLSNVGHPFVSVKAHNCRTDGL